MTTLFIDTTYDVTLGLLGDDRKWIELRSFHGQKSSVILQPEVLNLLHAHGKTPKSIKQIVSVSGPGFYTGIRLSEGFCDVFKFFQTPHYSFYTYEIPEWTGVPAGAWMTKAYRGEYFFHAWDQGSQKNDMIVAADLESTLRNSSRIFIHSPSSLDDLTLSLLENPTSTIDLLRSHPEKIFHQVFTQKLQRESFYFRPPEDEFKANP